jgi:hypothetical protein
MAGYPLPLYRQPFFLKREFGPFTGYRQTRPDFDYTKVSCPACERACSEEGCWFTQAMLLGTKDDMDDIVRAITKIYEHRRELVQ